MKCMGIVDHRKQLFENIVRLRSASFESPNNRDIVAVCSTLEQELGPTVSRRLAASLLGVSHTALARWITGGDIPTVYAASGRDEVPVPALLDLYDAVKRERAAGRRSRHVLEPTMTEGRNRAERITAAHLVGDDAEGIDGYRQPGLQGLAYHRALARRLRRPMIDQARHVLWKWRAQGKIDAHYADQWEALLDQPLPEIRRAVSEDSQAARDLRQNSPFAGMLSEPERRRILQELR
jgi:hypothetical protein